MNLCIQSPTFELAQESNSILPSIDLAYDDWQSRSNIDFHPATPGNRLRQNYNGTIEIIPKTPGQVIGEQILRPIVDATFSFASSSFNMMMKGFNVINNGINKMFQILPTAEAGEIGQIAYFEGNCPKGWKKYVHAQGRFILAAGSYTGRSHDGRLEKATYPIGGKGGEMQHKTTTNEMPSHTHRFRVNANGHVADRVLMGNVPGEGPGYSGGGNYHLGISGALMTPIGGSRPHNNMPPYITLEACQKINDLEATQLSKLQSTVTQNKMVLKALKTTVDMYKRSSNESVVTMSQLQNDLQKCKGNITHMSSNLKQFQQRILTKIEFSVTPTSQAPFDPTDTGKTSMDQSKKNKESIASLLTLFNDLKDQVRQLQYQTKSLKKKLKKLKKNKIKGDSEQLDE